MSPSLKAYKIPGRARLFEAVQRVREVNAQRLQTAIRQHKVVGGRTASTTLPAPLFDANALNADPALGLSYIVAPPRMQRYLDVSTQIYKTYLKYVSPVDIYPYSIDEVFIDVTGYLPYYHMSAHELAMTMVREVLYNTGITATAGIGTNLYLAKLAMDIVAKHIPADKDGVRIAELDEQSYRYLLWNHRPLTDFWMTGSGTVKRLEAHGIYTMGDLARFSIHEEDRLYEIFGVDAEILIDHAWGYEPCGMEQIKSYKPSTNSISEGQVLTCPYPNDKAKLRRPGDGGDLDVSPYRKEAGDGIHHLGGGLRPGERGQGRLPWSDPDRPLRQNHPQSGARHRPVRCSNQSRQHHHQRKRKAV